MHKPHKAKLENRPRKLKKRKGVYHLPSRHNRDIMVVVVEPQHLLGLFFVL
nr:MAG TPA: hypothetical protein [Caudoviricetes sp.]